MPSRHRPIRSIDYPKRRYSLLVSRPLIQNWQPLSLLQLPEPIDVVTPIGRPGYAVILEAMSDEYYFALVTFLQQNIRFARSYTYALGITKEDMRRIVEPQARPDR